MKMPVFFHSEQLTHNPVYEWAFGEKLDHPETSKRAENIIKALTEQDFPIHIPEAMDVKHIHKVHNKKLYELYRSAELELKEGETFHPSVFPKRDLTAGNPRNLNHAGYFCFDSGTPLYATTRLACEWSAACAFGATQHVLKGRSKVAYALSRPPGHHASRDLFGGYCYFNNAAIVAKYLRSKGKVAIIDIDFHHGNGTQDIFYQDDKVLFISMHGDTNIFYPYYTGHSNECGKGRGEGFNFNFPLASGCDEQAYLEVLEKKVLPLIHQYAPQFLIISAGFDTYKDDPIGKFVLENGSYHEIAGRLSLLGIPTLIVQEGGYFVDKLGDNVATFLNGFKP